MINMLPFLITFATSLILTPIVKRVAVLFGLIDRVDGDPLKIHRSSTPLFGGAAVFISLIIGAIVTQLLHVQIILSPLQVLGVIVCATIIFIIGLIDDKRKLNAKIRLIIHLVIGVAVAAMGWQINFFPVWWLAIPFTVIFVAYTINAYNLIDGMDGLCAGLAIISGIGFFMIGFLSSNWLMMGIAGLLTAALLGFLPYNFNVAKIFLGDAGSGLIGLLVSLVAIMAADQPYNLLRIVVVVLLVGVPLFDTLFAIGRRIKNRQPIFAGDRSHTYDFLLGRGLSQKKVWFFLCTAQAVLTMSGVLIYTFSL